MLSRFVLNQRSIDREVARGGAGVMEASLRQGLRAGQSVNTRLGEGGGALKRGASKRRRIGMWSEPVEGRGSDNSEKYGARRGQAKARSRTPGRPTSDMEN